MTDRPIRLRQICLIVDALEPVLDVLTEVFELQVCYGKADLSRYGVAPRPIPEFQTAFFEGLGLASAILPVGDCFLELVAPTRADTAAGRYLARKGPGGYMVITEVDSATPYARRAAEQNVRLAGEVDYPTYGEQQMDPRDIGAAILSFSEQREGKPFDGGWYPAGPDWRRCVAPAYQGIRAAVLTAADPESVARKWGAMIGRPARETEKGCFEIDLDGARLKFAFGNANRLTAIEIEVNDFGALRERCAAAGLDTDGKGEIRFAGIALRPAS